MAIMSLAERHLDIPYEKRWEFLKSTIVRIYQEERATLEQLRKRMADAYKFNAQYVFRCHKLLRPQPIRASTTPRPLIPKLSQSWLSLM